MHLDLEDNNDDDSPASLFADQPHLLVEPSILSAHLAPDDRSFVSPDGQLSERLFTALAARAGFSREDAREVLFDTGEFRPAEWDRLRTAVTDVLGRQLESYESQDSLFALLEVRCRRLLLAGIVSRLLTLMEDLRRRTALLAGRVDRPDHADGSDARARRADDAGRMPVRVARGGR